MSNKKKKVKCFILVAIIELIIQKRGKSVADLSCVKWEK
jgi:hypothetical protein